jgi:hypothetical protein
VSDRVKQSTKLAHLTPIYYVRWKLKEDMKLIRYLFVCSILSFASATLFSQKEQCLYPIIPHVDEIGWLEIDSPKIGDTIIIKRKQNTYVFFVLDCQGTMTMQKNRDGKLMVSGQYKGVEERFVVDTVWAQDDMGEMITVSYPNYKPMNIGTWNYYDEEGNIIKQTVKCITDYFVGLEMTDLTKSDSAQIKKQAELFIDDFLIKIIANNSVNKELINYPMKITDTAGTRYLQVNDTLNTEFFLNAESDSYSTWKSMIWMAQEGMCKFGYGFRHVLWIKDEIGPDLRLELVFNKIDGEWKLVEVVR